MKTDLQNFLHQLTEMQDQMFSMLQRKKSIFDKTEKETMALKEALAEINVEEEETLEKLQHIFKRREAILATARLQNIPSSSIEQLCDHFFPFNTDVLKMLAEAKHRAYLIQFIAYTNWAMSKKSLARFGQMLELFEKCGKENTIYLHNPLSVSSDDGYINRAA
jgi:hypothetical protein